MCRVRDVRGEYTSTRIPAATKVIVFRTHPGASWLVPKLLLSCTLTVLFAVVQQLGLLQVWMPFHLVDSGLQTKPNTHMHGCSHTKDQCLRRSYCHCWAIILDEQAGGQEP